MCLLSLSTGPFMTIGRCLLPQYKQAFRNVFSREGQVGLVESIDSHFMFGQ